MFDPTSRADVTVTSVHDSLRRERRSATRIRTKCVKYQNSLCCDGVEILQLHTVRHNLFSLRYFWAAASNVLCVGVNIHPEITAGWWLQIYSSRTECSCGAFWLVSVEGGGKVCGLVTFIGGHHIFPFSLSLLKTYACGLFCSCSVVRTSVT